MRYVVLLLLMLWLLLAGCNVAKDTQKTAEEGTKGAAGLADKMKGGTVGDTNPDTGESSSEQSDN